MGYATVQRTRNTEGRIVEELYFDADGNPVKLTTVLRMNTVTVL